MLLALTTNTACSGVSSQGKHRIDLRVENSGNTVLHNVKIKNLDENFFIPGVSRVILRPGIGSRFTNIPFRVPEWVEVFLEKDNGEKFSKKLQIKSRLPEDFQGTIIISINEESVLLSWKKRRINN